MTTSLGWATRLQCVPSFTADVGLLAEAVGLLAVAFGLLVGAVGLRAANPGSFNILSIKWLNMS
jgi:hypothetical protein